MNAFGISLAVASALAQQTAPPASPTPTPQDWQQRLAEVEADNAELARRLDLLAEELEQRELGDTFTPVGAGHSGLSPGASKIYEALGRLSIGGYGEMLYTDRQGGTTNDDLDFLRAVLYFGYKFDDRWLLNTEFEFEHATVEDTDTDDGTDDPDEAPGSVSVEFAYLEYQATASLALRAGLLLLPVGFINELHEPTTFYSANRPEIERLILPTTWRENGLGVVGGGEQWSYRAYLVNGFDASGFTSNGLRNGRQKGGEASAEDVALVGRLDYVGLENALLGLSAYWGNSGQNLDGVGNVRTQMVDLHGEYRFRGLRARALGVLARLGDTSELNDALGLTGDDAIGRELSGYYLELGYDVLAEGESDQSLIPFVRYEQYDTQDEVAFGFSEDPARDQSNWTFGLAYQPTSQVIFKVDYVDADNEANSGQDLFRLSMGYVF
jgi:hypothetical protein